VKPEVRNAKLKFGFAVPTLRRKNLESVPLCPQVLRVKVFEVDRWESRLTKRTAIFLQGSQPLNLAAMASLDPGLTKRGDVRMMCSLELKPLCTSRGLPWAGVTRALHAVVGEEHPPEKACHNALVMDQSPQNASGQSCGSSNVREIIHLHRRRLSLERYSFAPVRSTASKRIGSTSPSSRLSQKISRRRTNLLSASRTRMESKHETNDTTLPQRYP
jgi:hypothetical protein